MRAGPFEGDREQHTAGTACGQIVTNPGGQTQHLAGLEIPASVLGRNLDLAFQQMNEDGSVDDMIGQSGTGIERIYGRGQSALSDQNLLSMPVLPRRRLPHELPELLVQIKDFLSFCESCFRPLPQSLFTRHD